LGDLHPALAAARVNRVGDDDFVTDGRDGAELHLDVLEGFVPAAPGLVDAIDAARDAPVAPHPRVVLPLDLRRVGRLHRLAVAAPFGVEDPADDLDVLLGHGGASISFHAHPRSVSAQATAAGSLARSRRDRTIGRCTGSTPAHTARATWFSCRTKVAKSRVLCGRWRSS